MDIHVVQPGQTLYAIGREYGIAPGILARYNGLREPYRLAVGQSLLILRPLETVTVRAGDSLFSIASEAGLTLRELWRLNPNLSGGELLYPGQVLVTALENARTRPVELYGYAYPFAEERTLGGILPYAGALAPFTYGFTAAGELVEPEDGRLLALAERYGAQPVLHLSTLTENGTFSSLRAAELFSDPAAQERLAENVVREMKEKGYTGLDVDFEYLGRELAAAYPAFLRLLRAAVNAQGWALTAALAPKTYAAQPGVLYEGHDYRAVGEAADEVLLMTYEWGYTYGPPMAVAPIPSVRRVLDYAVTEIPPEKIFMGFPNYAYDWTLPYEAGTTRASVIGNEDAPRLAAEQGAEIEYDPASETPYFHYSDGSGAVHEVWFEDVRSSLAKFALVEEYGFRGLGYWNFMRPFAANFALLNARFTLPD